MSAPHSGKGAGRGRATVAVGDPTEVPGARYTAAIYLMGRDGACRVVGCGVCFRVSGHTFLLGAGHVLARVGEGLWIGRHAPTIPLRAACTLAEHAGVPPELYLVDLGVALLSPHDARCLRDLEFLPFTAVDLEGLPAPSERYYAVAPSRCELGPARDGRVDETPWQVVSGRPASEDDYDLCCVTAETHLVVRYASPGPRAGADGPQGIPDALGAPSALSGCGLWRRGGHPGGTDREPRDTLSGIVVAAAGGDARCLISAHPVFVMAGIAGFLGADATRVAFARAGPVRQPN